MQNNEDKLFFQGGPCQYNACVNSIYLDYSNYYYIDGYFYAANILAGSLIYNDFINDSYRELKNELTGDKIFEIYKDTLIFPLMFNYRQFIELALKIYINRLNIFLDEKKIKKNNKKSDHHIEGLSSMLINKIKKILNNSDFGLKDNEEAQHLEKYYKLLTVVCRDFKKFDNESTNFRYPHKKENFKEANITKELFPNILTLANKMQELHDFFQLLDFVLSNLEDCFNEI